MLLINPRLTLQSTTYILTESMRIHAVVYNYFGLLLDYLELLCYVSFQQPEPENERNIK